MGIPGFLGSLGNDETDDDPEQLKLVSPAGWPQKAKDELDVQAVSKRHVVKEQEHCLPNL